MDNILNNAMAVLGITPQRWLLLADRMPPELFDRNPAEGEWMAQGCLLHLISTEQSVFPARVRAFLAGQDFPAFNPNAQGRRMKPGQTANDLALEFARLRAETLILLESLKPEDRERRARHAELGEVSLSEMLHQIKKIKFTS